MAARTYRFQVGDEPLEPIDGKAWSAYTQQGRAHFERVQRSWRVFWRNANELVGLLHSVETNVHASLRLMQDRRSGDEELEKFHQEFWDALDQRLHNMVAGAVTLVDQTRPLVSFYEHAPDFQAEFRRRNSEVADRPRSAFVRRLRNYLLHCGAAPLMQTMSLGETTIEEWDHLRIKFAKAGLLRWNDWGSAREYIEAFEDGAPIREVMIEYAEDMRALYNWLFAQFPTLHTPGKPPAHLAEGRADWAQY